MKQPLNEAQQLADSLLNEGTVIVLNAGDDSGAAGIQAALQQLLANKGSSEPSAEPGERLQREARSGKRWDFRVSRDSAGSITSIQAQEL